MLKTTTVRGVMVRVASHVSRRRSLHVTVMSAQPSPAQPSPAQPSPAQPSQQCVPGTWQPGAGCSAQQVATVSTAHCALYRRNLATPYLQYKYQFSTLVCWPRLR